MVLQVIVGTNDDDTYTLRVVRRIARRQHVESQTAGTGIVFLEIDGLALPVLRRAMRDGNAPTMARWAEEDGYELVEWEPVLGRAGVHVSSVRIAQAYLELAVMVRALEGLGDAARVGAAPEARRIGWGRRLVESPHSRFQRPQRRRRFERPTPPPVASDLRVS